MIETISNQAPQFHAVPEPAMDMAPYTRVVIQKTGDVEDHRYRRGETHYVDAATMAALKAQGLLGDAAPTA